MGSIEFHHVGKRFDNGTEALRDLSITIPEGSMAFLSGHSGAGKSTFLKLLLRFENATAGSILVNGVNIARLAPRHLPRYRQHLGVVFQEHHLLAHRSVFENVALPLRSQALEIAKPAAAYAQHCRASACWRRNACCHAIFR